ncbi:MAG: 23S rRNA (adenine(2503)-C(2))-methyltransferase RlmN [Paludibacteraceae bacterium]|nr:23S rRNA (adenine(2503)-C(2))-methyltransferase RlmN [Paludibacteraceae bacterium]
MDKLLGKTLSELQTVALEAGLPKYTGQQLAKWLYVQRVSTFEEMTNISLHGRAYLQAHYIIGRQAPVAHAESIDGTKKYLFQVGDQFIETVYIPEEDRATLCVSTQAGCKMGCKFCMTGTLGFHGHLTAADILNQVLSVPESAQLTNIVLMGEGEPMDNIDQVLRFLDIMTADYGLAWSPKRLTVSSVGLIPGLRRLLNESDCHVAISLHNPFHVERAEMMPAERAYAIQQVIALLKQYDFSHQRRVSFEYICFGGVNDTPKHANELLRLLRGLECRVNLIRYHDGGQADFPASVEANMEWLRDYLTQHGLTTTIRRSRGEDILAACGMLVNALQKK